MVQSDFLFLLAIIIYALLLHYNFLRDTSTYNICLRQWTIILAQNHPRSAARRPTLRGGRANAHRPALLKRRHCRHQRTRNRDSLLGIAAHRRTLPRSSVGRSVARLLQVHMPTKILGLITNTCGRRRQRRWQINKVVNVI